jgi:hypothetical protein
VHTNLYVKVGRAERQCIGSFPDAKENDVRILAAQMAKAAELSQSGVASERVTFSTEVIGQSKKGAK